jgi:hypothetical protein
LRKQTEKVVVWLTSFNPVTRAELQAALIDHDKTNSHTSYISGECAFLW